MQTFNFILCIQGTQFSSFPREHSCWCAGGWNNFPLKGGRLSLRDEGGTPSKAAASSCQRSKLRWLGNLTKKPPRRILLEDLQAHPSLRIRQSRNTNRCRDYPVYFIRPRSLRIHQEELENVAREMSETSRSACGQVKKMDGWQTDGQTDGQRDGWLDGIITDHASSMLTAAFWFQRRVSNFQ